MLLRNLAIAVTSNLNQYVSNNWFVQDSELARQLGFEGSVVRGNVAGHRCICAGGHWERAFPNALMDGRGGRTSNRVWLESVLRKVNSDSHSNLKKGQGANHWGCHSSDANHGILLSLSRFSLNTYMNTFIFIVGGSVSQYGYERVAYMRYRSK